MKVPKPTRSAARPAGPERNLSSGAAPVPKNRFVYLLVLFCYSFIIYGQSLRFDFAMDDNIMIRLNKSVQKGTAGFNELFTKSMVFGSNGKNDGAYRPLTMMSFALDKSLFGNNPSAFHFINVLLYGLTGISLFVLLLYLFPGWHPLYPFLMTLLFLAHPVHTEVVANIKSRDELLSFLFSFLSLLVIFRPGKSPAAGRLIIAFILFLLACLSKETALTFVLIAPLTMLVFSKRAPKEIFLYSLPFASGAVLYLALRLSFLDSIGSGSAISILDNTLMAASGWQEKYATIIFITWKYLALLFFPHPLSWDYSIRQIPISHFSELRTILPLVLFILLAAYAFLKIFTRDIFAWCILFFFITLSLVSNIFIPIAATMAERFLYFPSVAFCIALVVAAVRLLKINTTMFPAQKGKAALTVLLIIFLAWSAKSYTRAGEWKNNLVLFESGVLAAPNSSRTHSALAYEYAVQAEKAKDPVTQRDFYSRSIDEFKKSLAIYEDNKDSWYNIAHTYDIMGSYEEAEKYYRITIEKNPKGANAFNNLGAILLRKRKFDEAIPLFNKAIALNPRYADPYGNLGAAYHFQDKYAEAIGYYEKALAINPTLQTVINNISKAKQSLQQK